MLDRLRATRKGQLGVIALAATFGAAALGAGWAVAATYSAPPVVGILVRASHDVRIDGVQSHEGTPLHDGQRVEAIRGHAWVQLGEARIAVVGEGAAITVGSQGGVATLHHGRARFWSADERGLRVITGKARLDGRLALFGVERTRTDDRVVLRVDEGTIDVVTDRGTRTIEAGQQATLVRGRIGRTASIARSRTNEEAPDLLEGLKRRAGRLVDDWAKR